LGWIAFSGRPDDPGAYRDFYGSGAGYAYIWGGGHPEFGMLGMNALHHLGQAFVPSDAAQQFGYVAGLHDAGQASGGQVAVSAGGMMAGLHGSGTLIHSVAQGVIGAISPPPAPCFPAGTLVHTDRGLVAIEKIQEGDRVLSRNEETGEVSYQRVTQTFRNRTHYLVTVDTGKEKIKATRSHPFYVEGKGWVAAKDLEKGDRLQTPEGEVLVVRAVAVKAIRGPPVATYNLEVEGTHTYFVGKVGVWVHNQQLQFPWGGPDCLA